MENIANRLKGFFVNYFTLTDQLVPQADAEQSIRDGVSFKGMNIIILILAILIASLGLNTNSTAVIIGAMLISPLMGPIIGIGLGVGIHDFDLIKRGLRNLLMASGFSVLASTLYFLISPVSEGHSELLARTSPTIYDVLIGFVGGMAGILAIGSRNKGNVIPGVAIATALMPPLCTAGYGLATWQLNYFFGAAYLFVINSIYIAFATFVGVKLMKFKGVAVVNDARAQKVRRIVYTAALLTMLPSVWLTYRMFTENNFRMDVSRFVAHECRFPDTQVLSATPYISDGKRHLDITLIGRVLPADSLRMVLSSHLALFGLQGTELRIIQGDANSAMNSDNSSVRDIYQLTQATITRQQQTIDSLRSLTETLNRRQNAADEIMPEIRVLFPTVKELAVTGSLVVATDSTHSDTTTVVIVTTAKPLPQETVKRMTQYLEARLMISPVTIVDLRPDAFIIPSKTGSSIK